LKSLLLGKDAQGCNAIHHAVDATSVMTGISMGVDWRETDNHGRTAIECLANRLAGHGALAVLLNKLDDNEDFLKFISPQVLGSINKVDDVRKVMRRVVSIVPTERWESLITTAVHIWLRNFTIDSEELEGILLALFNWPREDKFKDAGRAELLREYARQALGEDFDGGKWGDLFFDPQSHRQRLLRVSMRMSTIHVLELRQREWTRMNPLLKEILEKNGKSDWILRLFPPTPNSVWQLATDTAYRVAKLFHLV